jgi:hypothetical protein
VQVHPGLNTKNQRQRRNKPRWSSRLEPVSLLRQAESRKRLGYTFYYIIELVPPGTGLRIVSKGCWRNWAGRCSSLKTKASSFSLGVARPMDSPDAPPYTSSHAQAYCLLFSFQAMNTVASYCGSPLAFFSRETSWNASNGAAVPIPRRSHASWLACPACLCSRHLPARWSSRVN